MSKRIRKNEGIPVVRTVRLSSASSFVDELGIAKNGADGDHVDATHMKQFDMWINEKLELSDRKDIHQVNSAVDSPWCLPHYSVEEIRTLVDPHEGEEESMKWKDQARRKLMNSVVESGGALLVELEDASDRQILQDMWNFLSYLFDTTPETPDSFRHQTLTRSDDAACHQFSGYSFVQTCLNSDGSVLGLPNEVGTMGCDAVRDAYSFLNQLGESVAGSILASAQNMTLRESNQYIQAMLNDEQPQRQLSGTYHRLARYRSVRGEVGESLRSHCDWTLTTPIPVSQIAGLQIWNARHESWIQPEEGAWYGDNDANWNCRYCIILMGKWMELLTAGKVESCIHRVVAHSTQGNRYSAPFFLRPRDSLFADVAKRFDRGFEQGDFRHAIQHYLLPSLVPP